MKQLLPFIWVKHFYLKLKKPFLLKQDFFCSKFNEINLIILKGGNMKIPDKVKILMVLCSGFLFFTSGCVDTSVQTIPDKIVYHSQLQFTNLVTGAGTATLTLNGQLIGDVGFGEESSNLTVQSGSKTLSVNYANAAQQDYLFSADVDYKYRVFLIGTASSSDLVRNTQRYIFATPNVPSGSALVTFFDGSPVDTVISTDITGPQTGNAGTISVLGDFSSTTAFVPGDYSIAITVAYVDTVTQTFNYTLAAGHKYTAVVYDTLSTLKFNVFTDD